MILNVVQYCSVFSVLSFDLQCRIALTCVYIYIYSTLEGNGIQRVTAMIARIFAPNDLDSAAHACSS